MGSCWSDVVLGKVQRNSNGPSRMVNKQMARFSYSSFVTSSTAILHLIAKFRQRFPPDRPLVREICLALLTRFC